MLRQLFARWNSRDDSIGRFGRDGLFSKMFTVTIISLLFILPLAATAQGPLLPPPPLDYLVQRIALYPDPLLAQVLTASTYWDQIPDAAAWANQHTYLKGDALAAAIQADHLQWDPSILGLLPFPSVLDMMARDTAWTEELGDAVLNHRSEVMDAVQRMRLQARNYGYLVPNELRERGRQWRLHPDPSAESWTDLCSLLRSVRCLRPTPSGIRGRYGRALWAGRDYRSYV